MTEFDELIEQQYFGNSVWDLAVAATIFVVVFFALLLLRRLIHSHYTRPTAESQADLIELPLRVAGRTTLGFMLVAALYAGAETLTLSDPADAVVLTLFTIAAFWQAGLWATTALLAWLDRKRRRTLPSDQAAVGSIGVIAFIARATIWSFVLLLTLDNLGIEIKPLLAGLGIGGIAVALAMQNILGDLFASLSITLDRPFVVGDSLSVDEFSGTVEYIGVKSTRLRSVNGEQIIIPNANLLNSRVRNNTRLRERRVVFAISISQETRREQLQKIPGLIRALIEAQQDTRCDRSHFARITANSYDFEAVYHVLTADFGRHMDILQELNLRVLEELEAESIRIATPMQRLLLSKASADSVDDLLQG